MPFTKIEEELAPQYVNDEIHLLAYAIREKMKNMYELDELGKPKTIKNDKNETVFVYNKEHKGVSRLKPNKKIIDHFQSGKCNIEYTKHLLNMALALNIEVGNYIKHTPESK